MGKHLDGSGKADRSTLHGMSTPEHTKIVSRTRGVKVEIGVGPHGASQKEGDFGGLVSNNPFASLAQAGYMHTHPGILGKAGLSEWDAASKGRKIPQHVKK
jgi:hypothetical protein